jgi:DNA repair protein RecO (recombination protein O)
MLVTTESIILRSRKQGDTSKIVSLYTLDYGAVDIIAKGAREMKSKFGSALEPFTFSKVTFYKKEGRDLYLLSNAEVIQPHRALQSDLEHIESATKVIELLLRSQRHEESHSELFKLVQDTLAAMNECKSADALQSILFAYYQNYTSLAGFAIKLGSEIFDPKKNYYFDTERGEIFQMEHSANGSSGKFHSLSPEALASLRHLEQSGVQRAVNLWLSENACHDLDALFRAYFAVHIEGMQQHKTKSGRVFSAMKRKRAKE